MDIQLRKEMAHALQTNMEMAGVVGMDLKDLSEKYKEAKAEFDKIDALISPVQTLFKDLTVESAKNKGFSVFDLEVEESSTKEKILKRIYTEKPIVTGQRVRARMDNIDQKTGAVKQAGFYTEFALKDDNDLDLIGPRLLVKEFGTPTEYNFKKITKKTADGSITMTLEDRSNQKLVRMQMAFKSKDRADYLLFGRKRTENVMTLDTWEIGKTFENSDGKDQDMDVLTLNVGPDGMCFLLSFSTRSPLSNDKVVTKPQFIIAPDGTGSFRNGDGVGTAITQLGTYAGQMSTEMMPEGRGKLMATNGSVYDCTFKLGSPVHGKIVHPTENWQYEGDIVNYVPEGQGILQLSNKPPFKGKFRRGLPEIEPSDFGKGGIVTGEISQDKSYITGECILSRDMLGSDKLEEVPSNYQIVVKRKGTFLTSDNSQFGQGSYEDYRGTKYVGKFKDNKWNGEGRAEFFDGRVLEGVFTDNFVQGKGKMKFTDGIVYEGEFKNSVMHGQGTLLHANGLKIKATFDNGNIVSINHDNNDDHNSGGGGGLGTPVKEKKVTSGGATRFTPPGSNIQNMSVLSSLRFLSLRRARPFPALRPVWPKSFGMLRLLAKLR